MRISIGLCISSLIFPIMAVGMVLADEPVQKEWSEVAPGILVSPGRPHAYALVSSERAVVIGAARGADLGALKAHGVQAVELVLLTHAHRDSCARAAEFVREKIPVRAGLLSSDLLTPDGVRKFWLIAMPTPTTVREPHLRERTFNEWNYLTLAEGVEGVDCSLRAGQMLDFGEWTIEVCETPGHCRDHLAYVARRKDAPASPVVFCGDALSAPGKIWSPYTTDWEHWTGKGLQEAYQSLRRLALAKPAVLCPEHGAPITENAEAALRATAEVLEQAAALKSFEHFTKERLGNPPQVAFLAPKQVATAGDEPWTQLAPHLYLSGNTYVLASEAGAMLVLDAYGPRIVEQLARLRDERRLGSLEMVLVSHAHNDHFKGIFLLPNRDAFQVGTLRDVAQCLESPYTYCAPYLDARPLRVDRRFREGEVVRWREYELKIHHLPGQTQFGMGIETVIDGKKCFFTGDNFYHADQFSGSGGWSGRNRGLPWGYAASAEKILQAAPDWILAEHGGAFAFEREDFERRIRWARAAAAVADQLSPSGDHRRDWNPYRSEIEPLLQSIPRGASRTCTLVVANPSAEHETVTVELEGRGIVADRRETFVVEPGATLRRQFLIEVVPTAAAGRHIFPLIVSNRDSEAGADVFFAVDVQQTASSR